MKNSWKLIVLFLMLISVGGVHLSHGQGTENRKPVQVGVYYFDGWAGKNKHADNPSEPWAKDAPTHLTRRFVEEFSDRQPVWGWRDDSQEIMEKQIDLAADNGVDFFLFCWYWRDNKGPINAEAIQNLPHHTSLNLYMKAKNKHRVKFGLLVANHAGSEIVGPDNWAKATEYWLPYFQDPQHVTVDGKPLVVLFNTKGIDEEGLARMQKAATKGNLPGMAIAGCGTANTPGFMYRTHYNIVPGYAAGSEAHPYSELVEAHKKNWSGTPELPYIPEVTVGWDKRPWEEREGLGQKQGWYYTDRTVEQFKGFLNDAIQWMDTHPEQTTRERIMLLYAWNELGEGGYLVPTKGDPEARYLKAIREVVSDRKRK